MAASQDLVASSGVTGKRSVQLATLVVFVAFLDFFIGLPLVPTYADQLGATAMWVGVTVGAYSATNLVGNVGAGYFLDRFGRRLPITMGLALTALALVGYALASNWEMLLGGAWIARNGQLPFSPRAHSRCSAIRRRQRAGRGRWAGAPQALPSPPSSAHSLPEFLRTGSGMSRCFSLRRG